MDELYNNRIRSEILNTPSLNRELDKEIRKKKFQLAKYKALRKIKRLGNKIGNKVDRGLYKGKLKYRSSPKAKQVTYAIPRQEIIDKDKSRYFKQEYIKEKEVFLR